MSGFDGTNAPFESAVLDALATAVVFLDGGRRVRYANPAAENLFKFSQRSVLGLALQEVFADPSVLNSAVDYASTHNSSHSQLDLVLTTAGRERLDVGCTVSPVELMGQAGFLMEFNELQYQLKLAREERQIDQTEASRVLLRNLAHEIKNPLGGLRGAAQLLERELERPDLTEYTQVIMKEADRLQALMDRLLSPHRPPQLRTLNVHEALERVRSLVLAEYPEGIRLRRDYDVSAPDIVADHEQIIQALLNIGRNAAQALEGRGEITLRTRVVRQVTLARRLHRLGLMVQIIDNGPGITAEWQEKIFRPLVSRKQGGTGLGLTLAQTFINQHHGIIELQSEPGRTCFTILLPLPGDAGGVPDARRSAS